MKAHESLDAPHKRSTLHVWFISMQDEGWISRWTCADGKPAREFNERAADNNPSLSAKADSVSTNQTKKAAT